MWANQLLLSKSVLLEALQQQVEKQAVMADLIKRIRPSDAAAATTGSGSRGGPALPATAAAPAPLPPPSAAAGGNAALLPPGARPPPLDPPQLLQQQPPLPPDLPQASLSLDREFNFSKARAGAPLVSMHRWGWRTPYHWMLRQACMHGAVAGKQGKPPPVMRGKVFPMLQPPACRGSRRRQGGSRCWDVMCGCGHVLRR